MNVATIKNCDIANGLGVRVSLFVSGCTHRCKECFNPEAWDFNYGNPYTKETEKHILEMLKPKYIAGLSFLGGEPFEPVNSKVLAKLCERIRCEMPGKSIWSYSGYHFDNDMINGKLSGFPSTMKLLKCLDVLIDGKFMIELKDISLRFRGSSNQRLINVPESLKEGRAVLLEI